MISLVAPGSRLRTPHFRLGKVTTDFPAITEGLDKRVSADDCLPKKHAPFSKSFCRFGMLTLTLQALSMDVLFGAILSTDCVEHSNMRSMGIRASFTRFQHNI